MNEASPTTFTIGEAYGFISNIPFYGHDTLLRTMPVAIHMTGLPVLYDEGEEMDKEKFARFIAWRRTIARELFANLMLQMERQYPLVDLLAVAACLLPAYGINSGQMAALTASLKRLGVDTEYRVTLEPLDRAARKALQAKLEDPKLLEDEDILREAENSIFRSA